VSVSRVESTADGGRVVEVVTADAGAARCLNCGTVATSVKQNVVTRPKDPPYGESELRWHKRRWRCRRPDCARESFTERIDELPARARTTGRLRRAIAAAVSAGRSVGRGRSYPSAELAHGGPGARRARRAGAG
jgi:dipeptidyl aminopeptidase/acylaminoacyl peptidase